MKRISILFVMIAALALAYEAGAMSSTHYQFNWYVPLTGGGGVASSSHYAVNMTLGQSVVGHGASAHYSAGLGYWYGIGQARVYMPLVNRS